MVQLYDTCGRKNWKGKQWLERHTYVTTYRQRFGEFSRQIGEANQQNHDDNIDPDITWDLGVPKEFQTNGSFNQPSSSNPELYYET